MANRTFFACLILSLLLHILSMITIELIDLNQRTSDTIEIGLVSAPTPNSAEPDAPPLEQEPEKTSQIVEQSEKELNDEIPEDTRYLSRHHQKVLRETRAAQRGEFKNGGGNKNTPSLQGAPPKKWTKTSLPTLDELKPSVKWNQMMPDLSNSSDVLLAKQSGDTMDLPSSPPSGGSQDLEASQSDDYLKDTEVGVQTLLSTREFVYYSYYSRIKQQLRQHWEPRIKEKIHKILRTGRRIASAESRTTKVIITLDRTGTLIRVQVLGKSGIEDLDAAAIEAFRAAAPFPNPPKGIVDKDGTIKIRWNFVLEA